MSSFGIAAFVLMSHHFQDSQVQMDRNLCGRHALAIVAQYAGAPISSKAMDAVLPVEGAPFSLADLDQAARAVGLTTDLVRSRSVGNPDLTSPSILYWRKG